MSIRMEKVSSLIKEEISAIFQRNFSMSEYGFITITDVIMTADLKIAKVYVSIYGDKNQKKKSLALIESQKPIIRSILGHAIKLKFTPEIFFYLDESIDKMMRIENIFKKIHEDKQEKEDIIIK